VLTRSAYCLPATLILKRYRIATDEQLRPLLDEAERSGHSLQDVVLDAKLVSETELTKLFADYANIPYVEIQDQAISEGMITMQADGLVKTLRGNTTLDEVLRVTRES
jgi:type II secretory ATPase GspE/PulE/Tfp pilus assembly ATPase PilB-like protein